jgi:hypothetical protein
MPIHVLLCGYGSVTAQYSSAPLGEGITFWNQSRLCINIVIAKARLLTCRLVTFANEQGFSKCKWKRDFKDLNNVSLLFCISCKISFTQYSNPAHLPILKTFLIEKTLQKVTLLV